MIVLCSGEPSVRHEGDRIFATIPSGGVVVEIALNYGQATRLGEIMARKVREAVYSDNQAASAEIVALKRKKRRKA